MADYNERLSDAVFFYIWETVNFDLKLTSDTLDKVLEGCRDVRISFGQHNQELVGKDLSTKDVTLFPDTDIVRVHLSQTDTSLFTPGEVIVQVNILYEDMERDTSVQGVILAVNNLHRKVMV